MKTELLHLILYEQTQSPTENPFESSIEIIIRLLVSGYIYGPQLLGTRVDHVKTLMGSLGLRGSAMTIVQD